MQPEPFSLDLYDRKLLYELDKDSSLPLSTLAKHLRRSKQFTLFRQRRLEKAGVLTHYTAIIDMAKLGYFSFRLYFKFQNMTHKEYEALVEYLKKRPHVWTITRLHGKWDLAIFLGTKTMEGVHDVWDDLLARYKLQMAGYNLTLYAPIYNFNRTFMLEKEGEAQVRTYGVGPVEKVDDTDWRIIQMYAPDVRQPLVQLAAKLKLSPATVRKRIQNLEKRKIIAGYKIGLDIEKLGYQSYRMDLQLRSTAKNRELMEYCRQHPAIYQVQDTIGHSDFETEVVVREQDELLQLMDDIQTKFKDVVNDVSYFSYSTYHLLSYIPD